MRPWRGPAALFLGLGAVALMGCTVIRDVQLLPQSHFTPPNANVEPIGVVTGEASSTGTQPDFSPSLVEKAYKQALSKKGGDLLINVKFNRAVKAVPILILNIYTTTVKIEGTAAKMTVGKQQIGVLQQEEIQRLASQAPLPEAR